MKRMTCGELHRTIDGKVWAEQFILHCPANTAICLDQVQGWFSNAIIAGFDHGYWKGKRRGMMEAKRKAKIRSIKTGKAAA